MNLKRLFPVMVVLMTLLPGCEAAASSVRTYSLVGFVILLAAVAYVALLVRAADRELNFSGWLQATGIGTCLTGLIALLAYPLVGFFTGQWVASLGLVICAVIAIAVGVLMTHIGEICT